MACTHMNSCELFVQFAMNPALELWKIHYCESDQNKHCARYKASLTGLPVSLTLLPNGKSINVEVSDDELGGVTLFNAIIKHRTHMIRSLLRVGINLNVKNIEGITPLMAAARYNTVDIAKILLENGALPSMMNNDGETAFDIAVRMGNHDMARLLDPNADLTETQTETVIPAAKSVG